uniref:Uncharacterized protein n=1 Tax=Cacopsylla melanoneura TaxID=428564 RepID=A0A8D8X4N9_9HEMI
MYTRNSKAKGKSGKLVPPLTFLKSSTQKAASSVSSIKMNTSRRSISQTSSLRKSSDKIINKNDKPNTSVSAEPNKSVNTSAVVLDSKDDDKKTILSLQKLNSELLAAIQELRAELTEVKLQVSSQSSQNSESSQDNKTKTKSSHSNSPNPSQPVLVNLDVSSLSEIAGRPLVAVTHDDNSHFSISVDDIVEIENSISMKPKVKVIGTSMTRQVAEHLTTLLPEFIVSGDTFPGAKMATIIECLISSTAYYGPNDYIFIVGGTNDIPDLYPGMIDQYLESAKHVFSKTNVIFCGIPYMFHKSNLNSNIFAINQYVQFQCAKFKIYFLDTNMFLSRSMYTKHGLHFNTKGKIQFSEVIEKLVVLLENSMSSFFPLKYSYPFFM